MKKVATHFEQVPRVIAEKVLARQTSPPETEVAKNGETVEPKSSATVPAVRSRKL
jgi:hypothetical protein